MELRKDYILDKWVIISERRGARPHEFQKAQSDPTALSAQMKTCFFCPGNEHLTPPELDRFPGEGPWQLRAFLNKFPITEEQGTSIIRTDNTFFTFSNPYGRHEVVVETPDHDKQIWDLSAAELVNVLNMYKKRTKILYGPSDSKYVLIFKNHGSDAGTSIVHSHTQIISLNKVPTIIEQKIDASKRFGSCPYCRILDVEKGSYRRCFENEHAVAFTPYASKYNYEIWLFSKRHVRSFELLSEQELAGLAELMQKAFQRLKQLGCSFNFFFHNSPPGDILHFHIEITPRIAKWGGYELGSDIIINTVSPEAAATFYRGE